MKFVFTLLAVLALSTTVTVKSRDDTTTDDGIAVCYQLTYDDSVNACTELYNNILTAAGYTTATCSQNRCTELDMLSELAANAYSTEDCTITSDGAYSNTSQCSSTSTLMIFVALVAAAFSL